MRLCPFYRSAACRIGSKLLSRKGVAVFGDIKISPSILSADFMNFERDIRMLERGGTDFIHVDVMDGHFVPNLTLGVPFVSQLKKITDIPLDVHLMISNPLEQLDWYLKAGADWVSVHMEALHGEGEVREFIQRTREAGVHPALTLKPDYERVPGLFRPIIY